jgi:hypothetical protein
METALIIGVLVVVETALIVAIRAQGQEEAKERKRRK